MDVSKPFVFKRKKINRNNFDNSEIEKKKKNGSFGCKDLKTSIFLCGDQ
jgi:hypothetical protein